MVAPLPFDPAEATHLEAEVALIKVSVSGEFEVTDEPPNHNQIHVRPLPEKNLPSSSGGGDSLHAFPRIAATKKAGDLLCGFQVARRDARWTPAGWSDSCSSPKRMITSSERVSQKCRRLGSCSASARYTLAGSSRKLPRHHRPVVWHRILGEPYTGR